MVHIVLNGQIYNASGVVYTYPALDPYEKYPDWIRLLPESRFLREISNGDSCFSIRNGKEGVSYAYTTLNNADSRGGMAMVSLYTETAVATDGAKMNLVLRNLSSYFLGLHSREEIDFSHLDEMLKDLDGTLCTVPSDVFSDAADEKPAIRKYENILDLNTFLANAYQIEYLQYSWVHLIENSAYKLSSSQYPIIVTPISTWYYVVKGKVEVSKNIVKYGEELTLTYRDVEKGEYTTTIVVGKKNEYANLEGHRLHVLQDDELIIPYQKSVKLVFQGALEVAKNIIVEDVDGDAKKKANRKSISIEPGVSEYTIPSSKGCSVKVSAEGYETQSVTIHPTDKIVTIRLQEILHEVPLCVVDGCNVCKNEIKIKGTSDGFYQLLQYKMLALNLKNGLIAMVFLLLVMVCSAGMTWYVLQNYQVVVEQGEPVENEYLVDKVDSLNLVIEPKNKELEELQNENHSLKEQNNEQSKSQENPPVSTQSQSNADETVLTFLNDTTNNRLWCMQKVKRSKYVTFMSSLLLSKDFTFLEPEYNDIENKDWCEIKGMINDARSVHGDESVLKKIRSVITEEDDKKRLDKTINLQSIINKLKNNENI